MSIRYLSFDFDNCIFNTDYLKSITRDVVGCNSQLFNHIKETNADYDSTIVINGSNRQSYYIDLMNSQNTGSCFFAIQTIASHLEAMLDPFLMADIYGHLIDGVSFYRAIQSLSSSDSKHHAHWRYDSSKITLLYSQMHRAATSYPDEIIEFHFYEDQLELLSVLVDFFKARPEKMPKNVIFYPHHYQKAMDAAMDPIQGRGIIDRNYRVTIQTLTKDYIKLHPSENGLTKSLNILSEPVDIKRIKDNFYACSSKACQLLSDFMGKLGWFVACVALLLLSIASFQSSLIIAAGVSTGIFTGAGLSFFSESNKGTFNRDAYSQNFATPLAN